MDWHPDIPEDYRNQIVTGDARELAKRIPDESIDLIFTDPVYDRIEDYEWLAATASRVLKTRGHLIVFYQTNLAYQTLKAIFARGMMPVWTLASYRRGGPSRRTAIGHTKLTFAHFCIKEDTKMWQHNLVDVIENVTLPNGQKHHKWQKAEAATYKWINWLIQSGECVFDPFCGGGTVPAICRMLEHNYIAFEIDPDTAEMARERVLNTQPPLFVPEPEQLELT